MRDGTAEHFPEEPLLGHQHSGRLHTADKLVRREEHGVLLKEFPVQTTGNIRVDIDVDVGGRRGVIPKGLCGNSMGLKKDQKKALKSDKRLKESAINRENIQDIVI